MSFDAVSTQALAQPAVHTQNVSRFPFVDFLRGFAVILMVIFHLIYDLGDMRLIPNGIIFSGYFQWFGRTILFLFLSCVGLSLAMAHHRGIRWRDFAKRELQLVAYALVISVATYLAYPNRWVFFGILHFIAVASLVILPLLSRPWLSALGAAALLLPYYLWDYKLPWFDLPHAAMDYVPLFPWLGFVLIGIVGFHLGLHRLAPHANWLPWVRFLGRHSLVIYLIHQPLLIGALYGYLWLTK